MKRVLLYSVMFAAIALAACNSNSPENNSESGALEGKFSVSEKTQVYFSKGNLLYQPSDKTYQFAVNQYDVMGESNEKISPYYNGWIDLFIWGMKDPTQQTVEESDFATFNDWGKNKISNGGNKAGVWRTLTKDEWTYLYEGRENAAKLRGFATVKNVKGYVFLPDDWKLPADAEFKIEGEPEDNEYTAQDWKVLENAGAIFLPEAGMTFPDDEPEVDYVNKAGYYWSATPYEGELGDCYAFYIYSNYGTVSVSTDNISHGSSRFAVRLVKNVK